MKTLPIEVYGDTYFEVGEHFLLKCMGTLNFLGRQESSAFIDILYI